MFHRLPAGLSVRAALLGLAVLLSACPALAEPQEVAPKQVVAQLHARMQEVAAGGLTAQQQRDRLVGVVRTSYALRTIAEARLGAAWAGLTEAQRARLAQAVADRMVADHVGATGSVSGWTKTSRTRASVQAQVTDGRERHEVDRFLEERT